MSPGGIIKGWVFTQYGSSLSRSASWLYIQDFSNQQLTHSAFLSEQVCLVTMVREVVRFYWTMSPALVRSPPSCSVVTLVWETISVRMLVICKSSALNVSQVNLIPSLHGTMLAKLRHPASSPGLPSFFVAALDVWGCDEKAGEVWGWASCDLYCTESCSSHSLAGTLSQPLWGLLKVLT